MNNTVLPLPPHFQPRKVGKVWKVDYEALAVAANNWQREHQLKPAKQDEKKICLLAIDVQNTFCVPGFELFVGGRSGSGAVDDVRRLSRFIYRNLHHISRIIPTMDTHQAMQIFHSMFFVNSEGRHPAPMTMISTADVARGNWRVNTALAGQLGYSEEFLEKHLRFYTQRLERNSKYQLTVWPYHAMLGGIGHALASTFEEAMFFHSIARQSQPNFQIKGSHPLTEHYSALQPEVTHDANGRLMAGKNEDLFAMLMAYDAVIIAGEARSHCVAWTIDDLLKSISAVDPELARKVYLLDDCASSVCVPGVVDFTDDAEAAYARFAAAGMRRVRSTQGLHKWIDR